ncbi:MAG TPA: alanine--glyoxylate aminotransferase family protein [Chloroflexota bacterium]|nr:alanine--glyoxylate aminotransferase family protein [Chloroflexota bacterium]
MERKLLMIPGPIGFDPEVLRAQSRPSLSHTEAEFSAIFGRALRNMRQVFMCQGGQPFVLAGSGTLAMEFAAANFVERGDRAVVVDSGWFSQRYAQILERYTDDLEIVGGDAVGSLPPLEKVEAALKAKPTKILTITHVDTSTGVVAPVKELAELARKHGALSVVDGICATAACEFRQDDWQVDICFTGSQKAIGVPVGLGLIMVSDETMNRFNERRSAVPNYYCDINNWLPVMQAYEQDKAAYFATPAVNLIYALDVSIQQILAEGMEPRFERHIKLASAFREGMRALGIELLAQRGLEAPTISAMYYPEGVDAGLVAKVAGHGVTIAGGVLPGLAPKYFRVGHMGTCTASDIVATVGAIERGLADCGAKVSLGAGVAAAQQVLSD